MFYDKDTGQLIDGTPDEVQEKILSGKAIVKKGTNAVNVIDSEGNSAGSANLENLPELFKQGYRVETPKEKVVNDYVDENKGIVGAGKVLLTEAVDSALLSLPQIIADKTQDPLEIAKRQALKKEHEIASITGNAIGMLSPTGLLGKTVGTLGKPAGVLFKGADKAGKAVENMVAGKMTEVVGKGVATKLAPKVVGQAAEGAVIMAPQAITEAMLGDPNTAAESLMAGGALGGMFGLGVGVASPIFSKMSRFAKDKIKDLPKLKEVHEDAALNAIGASPAKKVQMKNDFGDVVDELPKFLDDITKGERKLLVEPKKLGQRIVDVEESSGKALGDTIKQLDEQVNKLYNQTDDAGKIALKEGMPNVQEIVKKIDEKFIQPYKGYEATAGQVKKAESLINDINNFVNTKLGGDPQALNLNAWREFQQLMKKSIKDAQYGTEAAIGIEANKFLRDEIQSYFKNLTPKIKETFPDLGALAEKFKNANNTYRVATTIGEMTQKYGERVDGKNFLGLMDTATAAAGAAATGNVGGAVAGIGARKLYDYARDWYKVGGLLLTEEAIGATAKKLDTIKKTMKNYVNAPAVKGVTISKISQITGDKKDDDYDALSTKLQSFVDNPQTNSFMNDLDQVSESGAPQIVESVKLKSIEAVSYLLSVMPKPLTPNNPLVKSKGFKPSSMEMTKFARQVKTALDPMSVIDDLNSNTLTTDQVEVLANVYPQLLEEIKFRVIEGVSENPAEVPYNKRLKLSLLLGLDLDPSLEPSIASIIMGQPAQEQPEQAQGGNPNAKFESYPTEVQRLQNKFS